MKLDQDLLVVVESSCHLLGLPEILVLAIIEVESGGHRYAARHEPNYRYLWDISRKQPFDRPVMYDSRGDVPDFPGGVTELVLQRTSLGPMQVMGATAREVGIIGDLLRLCGPAGIEIGCAYLARIRNKWYHPNGWNSVISAYNAGAPRRTQDGIFVNQEYVDRVIGVMSA